MCSGKYFEKRISVERTRLTAEFFERASNRKRVRSRRIAEHQWNELRNAVDSTLLTALVGRVGCPGCTDLPIERVEVTFSDSSKKFLETDDSARLWSVSELISRIERMAPLAPM